MSPQLKSIFLKEVNEVFGRKDYLLNIIINIVIFLGAGYVLVVGSTTGNIQKLFMELSIMVVPSFAMFLVGFPFIQEKFDNEKLIRRFEAILTTPISIRTVWFGKIASIFLLSYPVVIFIIILFILIWNILNGLNPVLILSAPVWVMALVIIPSLPMLYAGFSSWSVLRFTHPKLMQTLQFLGVGAFLLVFIGSGKFIRSIVGVHIVNWSIVVYSSLGIMVAFCLLLFLIYKLDKEKVTI